jgi:uncharacterized protein
VHPEVYTVVTQMAKDMGLPVAELIGNASKTQTINKKNYLTDTIGIHTIDDIIKELNKPGIDPRSQAQTFEFANIFSIEEVQVGMIVPGVVTNLTRFGAFVDIGVKQDGLVHVSEISHTYITDPNEKLKLNQKVDVKVLEVDIPRKRISLSIKQTQEPTSRPQSGKQQRPSAKKTTIAEPTMNDALSLLKNKFKK